ncbi:MAG TPA: glycosyltransferase family 39 protein [Gemmatimonadales bacterium]|nr:glycosyltransferase family 39 protein [Gemmatimonadales bacterium]
MASGWDQLALVAVVVGTALRARHFFAGQSLWLDEAMLALNILGKSCRELFGMLWYDQVAPPLYLCLTRATALPLGGSELGLRLPSLLAGTLALVLVWRVGRKLINPEAAAWAVWLLAISPLAIAYSNETKPYMLDALVAILLVGLAWPVVVGEQRRRVTPLLAGVGVVALLASFTAPFVLAGVGLVLFLDGAARRDPLAMRRAVGLGLLWLVTFLLFYFGMYRPFGSNEFLHAFWEGSFLVGGSEWRIQAVNAVTASLGSLPVPDPLVRVRYLLPLAAVLGPLAVRLAGWRVGLLLMIPNGVLLVAAMVRLHPLADRLVLFLAPAAVLLCAAGLVGAARWIGPDRPAVRAVLLGLVVGGGAVAEWRSPSPGPGGARVARDFVHRFSNQAGSAPVFLVGDAVPTWLYYTTNWRSPDTERLEWFGRQPPYGSATLAAIGVSPPDPALAVYRPSASTGGRIEMVSSPSGAGLRPEGRFRETFPTWGRDQATAVSALGFPVVWVPAAEASEIDALANGWLGLGGTVTKHEVVAGWTALELRAPAGAVDR